MLSDDDAIAAQRHILEGKTSFDEWRPTAAQPVTIAETGSTVLNLQSCMIEAVAGPMNNQHRVTGATNFQMSFSYGRALQQSALKIWAKNINNKINAQKIFNHRSKMNGLSTSAKWTLNLEKQIDT